MPEPLIPAELAWSPEGVPWSTRYGDVYHSAEGALGQARLVFLAGNRLPERWQTRDRFAILETGFGTGLNFLATWQAWRDDPGACRRLHYVAVEKHPFRVDDLARLHAAWPELAELAGQLRAAWPTLAPGLHRLELADGRVILSLLLGDGLTRLRKLRAGIDAFYLDGFAPAQNPDLWSPALLGELGRLANWGASLATWSVAVPVRDHLFKAGFKTATEPGYGRKKERLVGRFVGVDRPLVSPPERHAIILGAGVAGCSAAERLADRDWSITLIDRHPRPAMAASGNLAGILMPMLARDDNIAARLSRACYLYGLAYWRRLADQGARLATPGVMQFARTPDQERQMRDLLAGLALPEAFVRYLDQAEAGAWLGHPAPAGGWLFSQGGWANPPSLCRAALASAGARVECRFGQVAERIERRDGAWCVFDPSGAQLAEAATLIVAGGVGARDLASTAPLPIQSVRGQVTLVPEGLLPVMRAALCRDGYATPAVDGYHAVGASYDLDPDPAPWPSGDRDNLIRLAGLLPGLDLASAPPPGLASRVGFRPVAPDRLPIAGPLPDWHNLPNSTAARLADMNRQAGLYGLLGYASRGLVWAALLAESLASHLEGEPMPLEADLLDAVDPGRFALRKLRKGG